MPALEDLFSEQEVAEIVAMAADAGLSPEQLVRSLVMEVLEVHRAEQLVETVQRGEEPTMGLDELRNSEVLER